MQEMFDGEPWLDVSLMPVLRQVPAAVALQRVAPGRNTIWEIVNHLVSWKEWVLRGLTVAPEHTPESNYFHPVEDPSDAAWQASLDALEAAHGKWLRWLDTLQEQDLETIYAPNGHSWHYHIHGMIQHDAYHLGQIVLLQKLAE